MVTVLSEDFLMNATLRRCTAAILAAVMLVTAPGVPAYAAAGRSTTGAGAGKTMAMPVVSAMATPLMPGNGVSSLGSGKAFTTGVAAVGLADGASASAAASAKGNVNAAGAAHAAALALPSAALRANGGERLSVGVGLNGAKGIAAAGAGASSSDKKNGMVSALGVAASAAAAGVPAAAASADGILNTAFDGNVSRAASIGDGVAGQDGSGANHLPAATASNGNGDDGAVPPASGGGDGGAPQQPKKTSLAVVLLLAGAFGGAAWFFAPAVAALAAGLPYVGGWLAAHALTAKIGVITLGTLGGLAASQFSDWRGYPRAVFSTAGEAASGTYRFWARFGLIFDSVLRGKSTDEAMKAPLTPNIFKYPVAAWIPVLIGYVAAPVGFTIGFLYKAVDVPVRAAWHGLKQVALDFFPWLVDVARAIKRALKKVVPFLGGMFWGLLKGEGVAVGVGFMALALPIFRNVVAVSYDVDSVPGWIGARLVQLGGIVFGLLSGVIGAAVGLVIGLPYAVTESAHLALKYAGVDNKASKALAKWARFVTEGNGPNHLFEIQLSDEKVSVGQGLTRLLNLRLASFYLTPVLVVSGLIHYVRAWLSKGDENHGDHLDTSWVTEKAPGKADDSYLGEIVQGAKDTSVASWNMWKMVAVVTDSALRGRPVAEKELSVLKYPAYLAGAVVAAVGFVFGGVYEAVTIPLMGLWRGFVKLAEKFWPTLKRFINFLGRALKRIVPFVFGFVFGTISGVVQTGAAGTMALGWPYKEIFDYEGPSGQSGWQTAALNASKVLIAIPALVTAVVGFVWGLVVGIPAALTHGMALAMIWGDTGEKSEAWARSWRRHSFENAYERVGTMGAGAGFRSVSGGSAASRVLSAGLSTLLSAPVQALAMIPAWAAALPRAVKEAGMRARGEEVKPYSRKEGSPAEEKAAEARPWQAPPVWLAAGLGLTGIAAAIMIPAGLSLYATLVGWKLWTVWAGTVVGGLGVGLAASQPSFWQGLFGSAPADAKAAGSASWKLFAGLGDGFASVLKGKDADGSKLGWGHRAVGALTTIPSVIVGAAQSALYTGLRAAYEGATQVVEGFLPFLRGVWRTIVRIFKRIFPFVGGFIGGAVAGAAGAAAFGALLLGRPYFKYVVAPDVEAETFGQRLGRAGLKVAAFVAGVVFGTIGLAAGLLFAAPYALTLPFSMAFQFGEIGGKSQKFFDLWSKGSLRAEMRRVSQLTNKFEFPEPANGEIKLVDGWVRLANIFAATFAASIAATFAGWVAYFRSLRDAYRDLKAGKDVPSAGSEDMSRVSRTAKTGSKTGRKAGAWLGGWGTLLVMGYLAFTSSAVASGLGMAILWSALGWFGGWLAGLILGGVLGFGVGLILWLSDQLERQPPSAK
jgi:hypothetical protein